MKRKRSALEKKLIRGLRKLVKDIKGGKPMKASTLRQEQTPDGPITTRVTKTVSY
jgi:hypothetical protein